MTRSFFWLACASLAATSSAQVTPRAGGYQFRLHLVAGERLAFVAPVSISGLGSGSVNLKLRLLLRVLSVKAGIASVHGTLKPANYQGQSLMGAKSATIRVDRQGRVIGQTGGLVGFCMAFPQLPVKVGGSFVAKVPVMAGSGSDSSVGVADAVFTFRGFVGKGRSRGARLTFVVAGNQAPSGSVIVSIADGVLLKYYTNFKVDMGQSAPLKVKATFVRS